MNSKVIIWLIALGLFFSSCNELPAWEKLIRDYIAQSELVDENTSMEIKSIEKVGEVLASDSLKLYCEEFNSQTRMQDPQFTDHILSTCEETIKTYSELIIELNQKVDSLQKMVGEIDETEKDKNKIYKDLLTFSEYEIYSKSLQRSRDLKNKYQHLHDRLESYKTNSDRPLAMKYQCILMESSSDTIPPKSMFFYLNPMEDKILAVTDQ